MTGNTFEGPKMVDYTTYDEIKIGALLQVSSPVLPINAGSRQNRAQQGKEGTFVKDAVYVGAVGPRLVECLQQMEWQEIGITPEQNTKRKCILFNELHYLNLRWILIDIAENGYGEAASPSLLTLFSKFYDKEFLPTYEDCQIGRIKGAVTAKR